MRGRLQRHIDRLGDIHIVRSAMIGMMAGALAFIGLDLLAIYDEETTRAARPVVTVAAVYVDAAPRRQLRENLRPESEPSQQRLRFTLKEGGVVAVEGSIDPDSARRLAEGIETWGDRVKLLSLDSPGGSLEEAMAMARLVRQKGLSTKVAAGAVCASSCPLLFAGGVSRQVEEDGAIALHQFYNAPDARATDPARAISDAQSTAARIVRHLSDMGVDPAMWLHALDTPPQRLYYLSSEQLAKYRLIDAGIRHAGI